MGNPTSRVQPGVVGIHQRQDVMRDALTKALSPEEMWQQTVQSQRGFLSSPSGAADRGRQQPASIPQGAVAGDKGVKVGKGYETFTGIQILDKDGRRIAFGADFFDSGGPDMHAEAKVVRAFEKNGPVTVPGGRLMVVVEQDCCPSCEERLRAYARKIGSTDIDVYVPQRESLTQAGKAVSPKTAATTSFQNTGKPTTVKKLRRMSVAVPSLAASGGPSATASRARTAIVGTIASLGAGVALGILQSTMKSEMLKSIEGMPKPQRDARGAGTFFSDPKTGKAIRVIDLLGKNLKSFGRELNEHHAKLIASANLEVGLLAVSTLSFPERLEFLSGLEDQHAIYAQQLDVVFDNLEAAKALGPNAIESARAAEDLARLVDRALVADWLLKNGFAFEEIVDIHQNLKGYASRVRAVFQDVDALHADVQRLMREQAAQASSVNRLRWSLILARAAEEAKKDH